MKYSITAHPHGAAADLPGAFGRAGESFTLFSLELARVALIRRRRLEAGIAWGVFAAVLLGALLAGWHTGRGLW